MLPDAENAACSLQFAPLLANTCALPLPKLLTGSTTTTVSPLIATAVPKSSPVCDVDDTRRVPPDAPEELLAAPSAAATPRSPTATFFVLMGHLRPWRTRS